MFAIEALCRVMTTHPDIMGEYKHFSNQRKSTSLVQDGKSIGKGQDIDTTQKTQRIFRFLDLPVEIRLKIYGHLLPSKKYSITRPINISPNLSSSQSYTVALTSPIGPFSTTPQNQTSILRTSHKIHVEALPILYSSSGTSFSFGVHLDLVPTFFNQLSSLARFKIKRLSIAREIWTESELAGAGGDWGWINFCDGLKKLLPALTGVELTFWKAPASNAKRIGIPDVFPSSVEELRELLHDENCGRGEGLLEVAEKWKEYPWVRPLLAHPSLKTMSIRWWEFCPSPRVATSSIETQTTSNVNNNIMLPHSLTSAPGFWAIVSGGIYSTNGVQSTQTMAVSHDNLNSSPGTSGQNSEGGDAERKRKGDQTWMARRMVVDDALRGRMLYDGLVEEGRVVLGCGYET